MINSGKTYTSVDMFHNKPTLIAIRSAQFTQCTTYWFISIFLDSFLASYNIPPVSECDQDIGESSLFRPALAGGCFEMDAIRHCALSKLIAISILNLMFGYILTDYRRRNTGPRSSQSFDRHAQLLVSFQIKQEVTRASGPRLPSTRAGSPAKSSNGLPILRTFLPRRCSC
jgi:hypothetical protein